MHFGAGCLAAVFMRGFLNMEGIEYPVKLLFNHKSLVSHFIMVPERRCRYHIAQENIPIIFKQSKSA